jgi:phage gp29-like protein
MAEQQAQTVPPLPPKGEMIPANSLYMQQLSLYRNTFAFGGTRNPTEIWAAMTYNMPQVMAYFREIEEKDEDVADKLDSLKLSVLERARSVQAATEDDNQAVEVKEFIEAELQKVDFHNVLDCILDAPGYGFSVQEMIFDVSAGQASLIEISDCPQELFLFGNRFRPQTGNLQLLDNPWMSEGAEVPEQKFLITTYRKRGRNRMGRPLLRGVFWPSWFKRNMQRLWMNFAEKGPGTAVVRYNDPNSEEERQEAAAIAQAIVDNTAIAVPKSFDYDKELLQIARAQDPAVYEKFYQAMQYNIARRILGETLTSFGNEGGTGAKAQGEVHANTLDQRSIELCRSVEMVINTQLIRPLVLWNFGPAAPMPKWGFDLEEEEDLQKRLTIDAGLQKMGKKFTAGYIADRYDVPLVAKVPAADGDDANTGDSEGEEPDTVLKPASAPAAVPQPAAQPVQESEFSENEEQARREMTEFDKLFDQLRDDATGLLKERVGEIARAAAPVVRA